LLMTRIFANDHDPTMTPDHFALLTHRFDAWTNLHPFSSRSRLSWLGLEHGSGRRPNRSPDPPAGLL